MGIRLIVEVLDHAPTDLTPAERLVLLVLAESANDTTRTGWPGMDAISRRSGLAPDSVRRVFQRLRDRGCEVRVVVGKDRHGKPMYAYDGRQSSYRLPRFDLKSRDERPATEAVPPSRLSVPEAGRGSGSGGTVVPQRRDERPALPLTEPSKNPQKQQRPRAPQRAGAQQLPPHIAIIVDATGATPDEAQAVAQLVNDEKTPGNLNGFLRRLATDGELPDWLDRVRATGDRDRRAEFMNHIHGQPPCAHGQPGGHIQSPGGWVACPQERRRLTNPTSGHSPTGAAQAAFEEMTRLTAAGREDDAALVLADLPDDVLDEVDRLEAAAKTDRYAPPKSKPARPPGGHRPFLNPDDQSRYFEPL